MSLLNCDGPSLEFAIKVVFLERTMVGCTNSLGALMRKLFGLGRINVAKFGLNYRFAPAPALAPVAARY